MLDFTPAQLGNVVQNAIDLKKVRHLLGAMKTVQGPYLTQGVVLYWGMCVLHWGMRVLYWGMRVLYWGMCVLYWGMCVLYWGTRVLRGARVCYFGACVCCGWGSSRRPSLAPSGRHTWAGSHLPSFAENNSFAIALMLITWVLQSWSSGVGWFALVA
jgi:hypothetical protein